MMRRLPPYLLILLAGCGGDDGADAADASVADSSAPDALAPDATVPICVAGSATFPRSLELPEATSNGVFDPNFVRDPASDRLWVTYSGVVGMTGNNAEVSTFLSYSDDDGVTWCYLGEVNPIIDVPRAEQPPAIAMDDGHWQNEVSALFYDADAAAGERWTLIWHRYLHIDDGNVATDDRHFEHGWIAQRRASSVEGLMTATDTKLFSSAAYHAPANEAYNNDAPGGLPEKRWDLDPDLGSCLAFTEPGAIVIGGTVYIAMFCFRSDTEQDVVLVKREADTWEFASVLLTTANAEFINPALVGFNAPDIVAVGNEFRLLVSPLSAGAYLGCLEYEFDPVTETLVDANADNQPDALSGYEKNMDPDVFQTGACTYDEDSPLGLVVGDTYTTGVQFRLIATGQTL